MSKLSVKRLSVLALGLLLATFASNNPASAADVQTNTQVYLDVVRCDANTYDMTKASGLRNCYNAFVAGNLSSYVVSSDTLINAGDYLLIVPHVVPDPAINPNNELEQGIKDVLIYFTIPTSMTLLASGTGTPYSVATAAPWDTHQVEYYDEDMEETYYPWTYKAPTYNATTRKVMDRIYWNSGPKVGLYQDTKMPFFGVKINSDIQAGSDGIIHIGADKTEESSMAHFNGDVILYHTTDYQANYGGTAPSQDATLSALSVTKTDGSTTYPLDPTFTADTAAVAQKVYSTKVPSGVSQIKINATANDNKAQDIKLFDGNEQNTASGGTSIVSGTTTPIVGVGTKSVNPGANEFTIAVTSENGNILNQVVNVYRLSSDADLTNLSVDSYSFEESFGANTTAYTIRDVPYSVKSLNVVGQKHDSKASVTGLGAWNFDTDPTSAQTFTRDVIVTPEECSYTTGNTEVVQGASCNRKTYRITVNRDAASTDANLKSLSASYVRTTGSQDSTVNLITSSSAGQTFTLKDASNNESVPYDASSVTFTAQANQAKAKKMTIKVNNGSATNINTSGTPISGSATCALNVGDNTCVIEVTAEDGTHKQAYTINVHRRSNDASLKTLTVNSTPVASAGGLSPAFPSSSNDTYSYLYSEYAPSYVIAATVNDTDKTKTVVMNRSGVTKSTTGNSISESYTPSYDKDSADEVTITVTAEDGNTRIYKINLTREVSSDATLSNIVVTTSNGTTSETHTITPVVNDYDYEIEVEPDVDRITAVSADTTSTHATVNASDITFNSGAISYPTTLDFGSGNILKIKGTPEKSNAAKSQYTVTIKRKKYNIAGATKIEISYGSTGTWEEIPNVSANSDGTFNLYTEQNPLPYSTGKYSIRVTPANEYAIISGDGTNIDLIPKSNNQRVVTVKSQDEKTTRTYTINIYRQGNPNTDINDLVVKTTYRPSLVGEEDGKTVYTLDVPYAINQIKESDVAVTTADTFASVTRSGTLNLNEGVPADYNFTVTSQAGNTKDYVIRITRQLDTVSGASAIDLRLSTESTASRTCTPAANSTACSFSIPYDKSQYYLEAHIPDSATQAHDSEYVNSDDLLTISDTGTSTHKIKVISQDKSSETEYTITVTRDKSTDVSLANLYLNYTDGDQAVVNQQIEGFSPTKTAYYIEVPGTVGEMRVGAELADKRGTFTSTNTNADYDSGVVTLQYGLTPISFTVKSEKGGEQTYYVNVTRKSKTNPYIQNIKIGDTDLSDLLIDGQTYTGDQANDPNGYEYTLKNFPNSTSAILISATMVDEPVGSEPGASATLVTGGLALPQSVGIKTLHYGGADKLDNRIEIYGIAHDGTTKQKYILHVYRDPSDDNRPSDQNDAVQIFWDGSWHNAEWDGSDRAFKITVPNSVNTIKGGTSGNLIANPMAAPTNGAAGTIIYDPDMTLVTNDPITENVNSYFFKVVSESGKVSNPYEVKITKTKSDNAKLASVSVNDAYSTVIGSFKPSFGPDKPGPYEVTVGKDVSEIYIAATPAEGHANIDGIGGPFAIDGEDDTFTITVTPENNDPNKIKTYTLNIVREKSDDATLSAFSVTDLNDVAYEMVPPFESGVSNVTYQVTIPGDQDRVKLKYTGSTNLADGVAQTISYTETPDEGTTNTYSIPTGGNRTIGVRVLAENGTTEKTYNVKVTRTPRTEAALDALTYTYSNSQAGVISNCNIGDNGEYICNMGSIPNSGPTTVTFGAHATDDQAQITGDVFTPLQIKTGTNNYKITVTAEDGATKQVYNIVLIKLPSEDALLTNITVKNYSIGNFSSMTTEYEVEVGQDDEKFSSSNLTISKANNQAMVDTSGEIDLYTGQDNFFYIDVRPESCKDEYAYLVTQGLVSCDSRTMRYSINVKRPYSTNNKLASLEVDKDLQKGASLSPNFSTTGQFYTITIPYGGTEFDITAIPEKDVSTVKDSNNCTFKDSNNHTCTVTYASLEADPTDDSGERKLYKITVTPQAGTGAREIEFKVVIAKSDDKTLSKLKVLDTDGNQIATTPGFDPAELDYIIPDITNDVEAIVVQAKANNSDATIRYIYQNNDVCGDVASCRIEINPSKKSQVIKVEVKPADGSKEETYEIDFNIKDDDDADLASLTVSAPGVLNKEFNPGDTEYTVTGLTYENTTAPITLSFKTSDPDAKININAAGDQTSGTQTWTTDFTFDPDNKNSQTLVAVIKVTAEDGTPKTYTVTATRAAALASTDATLSSLNVTDETLSPSFNSDHEEYDLGLIEYQKRSIEVNIGPNNGEARVFVNGDEVEINGGIATTTVNAPLTNDEQTVTIRVLAGDNITDKYYTIKFRKEGDNDATLESLVFSAGSLDKDFTPAEEKYTLTIGPGDQPTVTAVPAGKNATMTFGSTGSMKNLNSGVPMGISGLTATTNERKLVVMAEDGTIKTYTITIVRASGEDRITSHDYGHEIHNGYIWSVADRNIGDSDSDYENAISGTMTVGLLKSQLDNPAENLYIYAPKRDTNGNIIMDSGDMPTYNDAELADTDKIGTGAKVVLKIDGVIKDTDIVVIRGDTDGDGKVTMNDFSLIKDTYLEYDDDDNPIGLTSQPFLNAANVDMDASAKITMNDFAIVKDHYLMYDDDDNLILIDYRSMLNPSGGATSGG